MPQTSPTVLLITFLLFVFFQAVFLIKRRSVYQNKGVAWFTRPKNRPAVYVLQSVARPDCFKVGYTSRRVEARIREIETRHGEVRLIYSYRMPHAFAAEQAAHGRLRRTFGVKSLGGEWYQTRKGGRFVKKITLKTARSVKRKAVLRFSWPKRAKIFVWKDVN